MRSFPEWEIETKWFVFFTIGGFLLRDKFRLRVEGVIDIVVVIVGLVIFYRGFFMLLFFE